MNNIPTLLTRAELVDRVAWLSPGQLRHLLNHREQNGLAESGAIVRLGRALRIDLDRFGKWLDAQRETGEAA